MRIAVGRVSLSIDTIVSQTHSAKESLRTALPSLILLFTTNAQTPNLALEHSHSLPKSLMFIVRSLTNNLVFDSPPCAYQ